MTTDGPDKGPPPEPFLGYTSRMFLASVKSWRLRAFLLDDDGRIGRKAFWSYFFVVMLMAFGIFFSKTLRPNPNVHLAFGLILLFPSYCVFAKRFQDIGINGGWAILIIGISAIDVVLASTGLKAHPGRFLRAMEIWSFVGLVNMSVFFTLLGLWPGSDGANRYGLRFPPW